MKLAHRFASKAGISLRWMLLLLFVPALVFVTGCDSSGNGGVGNGDGNGTGDEPVGLLEPGPVDESDTMVEVDSDDDGTAERVRVTDVGNNGVVPPDADGNSVTWSSDKIYELNGFVFVNPGDTLNIE